MAKRMHRAQILLEPEQHQALADLAKRDDRSISDVVRQIIGEWLENQEVDVLWGKRMEALEQLRVIRESIQQQYGVIQEDLLAEVREERDRDSDNILGGGT